MRILILLLLVALTNLSGAQVDSAPSLSTEIADICKAVAPRLKAPTPELKPEPGTIEGIPSGGRELVVEAYAYCLRGVTASGRYTRHGVIAVDPRVIPLGSKIYVPGYGWGIAADTGGAIKGSKIDLWMPSASECYVWGIRRVKIQVFPR